jgi:homogentisate phytyltransferase/homogentisate geranylgeranyltransferase
MTSAADNHNHHAADPHPDRAGPASPPVPWWHVLWRFGRPHTLVGTTLAVGALFAIAAAEAAASVTGAGFQAARDLPPIAPATVLLLIGTWLAALAANVSVVGLNQLTDVAIDRVNKPALPLPAGHLPYASARRIVLALAVCALGLAAWLGPWLLATVAASIAIGSAYSLPPLRLKRHAAAAALSIATVRGPLVNLGLYGHFCDRLDGPAGWPASVLLLASFFFLFTLGIAVAKDIGDVAGDRRFHIATFAVRRGERSALRLALLLLATPYLLVIAFGLRGLPEPRAWMLATTHAILLAMLIAHGTKTQLDLPESISGWYRGIWRMFYVEYALWLGFLAWWRP